MTMAQEMRNSRAMQAENLLARTTSQDSMHIEKFKEV